MIINSIKKNTLTSLVSLASCGIMLSSAAQANPVGGTVQAGTVNIQSVGPNTLQIDQLTQKAIIDWRSFSTNPQDIVRFLQPNASAVILNRVVGQDPSILLGQLLANGNVFLLNPNGIVFGPGSITNVGGLLASTLKMTNEDFLKGNYSLAQDPNFKLSSVVNQGTITITDGGYAVLAAPLVSNEGLIVANLGKVVLGAGEKMTLNFDGRNILNFRVDKLTGAPGTVLIGKDQLSSLLSQVITHPNLIEAGSITNNSDGTVSLGGSSGTLIQAGQISTNGLQGQKAGTVVLDSGQVTVVGPSALVEARGQGLNSAGGEVIVNSRGATVTTAGSKLDTQGGTTGSGGFIETSGKNAFLRGTVNPGKGGSYLLDPIDLNIVDGNGGTLDGLLPNVSGGGAFETISEIALESMAPGSNITLQADNSIFLESITDGVISLSPNTSLNLVSGGDFSASNNNDRIAASGTGQIRITTGTRADLPSLTATNDIHIQAGTEVRINTAVVSTAGTVNIVALSGDALTITGFSDGYVGGNNASINATGVIEGRFFGEGTTPFFTRLNGQLSSSGSSTNIQNTGNVSVGNVGNLAGMVSGPLCFVNQGNLVINSTINSTVNSILQVTGNVDFTSSGNIVAADTVSLEVGGNTTDAGVLTDAAIIAPNFVLNTTGDVGSISQPLITTVSNVAAQSTDGSISVRNENSSNPLTLSQLSTLKGGQIITGVNAGVNASVQATNDIVVENSIVAVGDAGLLANGNISFTAGNIQAGNTAVVGGRELVGGAGVDVNATSAIIQGILSAGSQADPLQTTVGNLAGGSFAGNFFVNNTAPTLNVANVTSDLFGVGTVTELEVRFGSGIICLENTGNIVVAAPIISSGNVALRSGGEISITTGRLEAVDTVSLESEGNILDDNTPTIDVNATNFVTISNTGSVGLASDGLEVAAANLSVQASGGIAVNSISGDMTVADLATLKGAASLIGVSGSGDIHLDASAGALNVNSTVTGANIHFGSLNNTSIDTAVQTLNQIEVVAGNIIDSGKGSLSAPEIILVATSNVGSNANPLDISAQNLAGTSGGDYVVNQTGGLVIGNLTSFRSGTDYNGINAGGNVCIDVSPSGQGPSNLNISSPINATNSVALRVNANPVLSADIQAGALVSAGNTISAEAANGTIENTGAGNVNFQAANVVLAAQSIGASNAIQTNTTNLAAQSSIGRVSIVDRGPHLTTGNLTTVKGGTAISGINSSSDVSLLGSNLTVQSRVRAVTNTAIELDGDLDFQFPSTVSAGNTVSLEVGGNIFGSGSTAVSGSNVVINATGNIGVLGGTSLFVLSDRFAAQSTGGSVQLVARAPGFSGFSSTTVSQLTTIRGGTVVTGVNAAGNVSLASSTTRLVLESNVSAGRDAEVSASFGGFIGGGLFTNGTVMAGNTAILSGLISTVAGSQPNVVAPNLLLYGGFGARGIGTAAQPVRASVSNIAGSVSNGDVYVSNSEPNLQVTTLNTSIPFSLTFTGLSARNVTLENAGNIMVDSGVFSSANISLVSGGELVSNTFIVGTNTVSLEAVGNIVDGNGAIRNVNATNFVALSNTGSVGFSNDALEVTAGNLAVRAAGSVAVNDTDGNLTITDLTTLKGGTAVSGVNAGGNVCIDASAGSLAVNSAVSGANVHLGALNDVAVNANVNATTQLEILATNGGISGGGLLQAQDMILASNTSIGSSATPFNVSAQNFAANSSSGDVYATASNSLAIANLTSFKSGTSYNGVSAAGNVCIDLPVGVLNVSGGISAGNTVALRVLDGIQAGGLVSAGNTVSAESANGTIENTGAGNVNFQSANVVLAAQSIGANNAIQTNTTNLAARSSNGTISVVDRGGNVTVNNLTTLKGGTAVRGVNSSSDVSLVGNNITVASSINASTNVALMSNNNTYFVGGSNITAPDTISLEAGGVVSGDNVGPLPGLGAAYTLSTNLVLDASGGVNGAGSGRLIVSAANIAGRSTTGDLLLIDRLTSSPIAVTNLTTLKGNQLISGLTAAGNIEFAQSFSAAQPLNLDSNVTAGQNVNLFPGSNLTFNGGIIQAGNTVSINRAATGQITSAPGNAVDINATNLALVYAGNIGTAANPLETSVSRLGGGAINAFIRNSSLTLDLTFVNVTYASGFNLTLNGFENGIFGPPGLFSLENTGNILVSAPIYHSEVALRSGGDIVLGAAGIRGGLTPAFTVANTVSLEATGSIISNATDPNNLLVNATNFVALAGGNVGTSANVLLVSANNVAARAGGSIVVNDTVGNLTITGLTTLQGGTSVTGVNAGGNVCVDASGGSLNVNSTVTGANVHLGALTNVLVNANVNATTQLEVTATNGGISGGGLLQAPDLIMASNTSIGSAATPFNVLAQNFAANSSSGDVYATSSSSLTVANLTSFKSGTTYNGVSAAGDVCIDLPGGVLNVSGGVSAGDTVALRARDGIQAGGLVTAGNAISAESANGTIENTGAGNVNFQSANVVLAAQSIGANNAIQTNATTLAAFGNTGGVSIIDRGPEVTVGTLANLKSGQTVTGIRTLQSGDVCLESIGNTVLTSSITSRGNVAIRSGGEISLLSSASFPMNPAQILASNHTVSLEAAGNIAANLLAGAPSARLSATNVVLLAGGDIGLNGGLSTDATNVAANSTGGSVVLSDTRLIGAVNVSSLSTLKGGVTVSGLAALGNVRLNTSGNVSVLNNIVAGNEAVVISQRALTLDTGSVTAGNTVFLSAGNALSSVSTNTNIFARNLFVGGRTVGTSLNPLHTSVSNVAGQVSGNAFLNNTSPTLEVANVSLESSPVVLSGFSAGNLTLDSSGNVVLSASASGTNVSIRSGADIVVGTGNVQATNTAILIAVGNVRDGNSASDDIVATNFVARAASGSVGQIGDALEVSVSNIAIQASSGSVAINDTVGNLTIRDLSDLNGGVVFGIIAGGNVCVDAGSGSLVADSFAIGANVHLGALDDVAVNAYINATNQMEVLATNGGISTSGAGQIQARDLILAANTSVGSAAVPVNVLSPNFAANSSSGDVYATASNSLTVANLTSFKSGNTYNGVSAAGNVCIDLAGGVLNVSGGISAGNTVALRALDGIQAGGLVSAGNTVSAESANGAIENTGTGSVNFQSANVVLAAQSIGASNAIQTNATTLAAQSSNGTISIVDRGGAVTISNLTTLKGAQAITGINSSSDVSLVGGNVTVDSSVRAVTNAAVVAGGNLNFTNPGQIRASDTVSLEVTGNVFKAVPGGDAVVSPNFVVNADGFVGASLVDYLAVSATNVAAQSATDSVNLFNSNSTVVANLTTINGGASIPGLNAAVNVNLSTLGNTTLSSNINAGGIAQVNGRNVNFVTGGITAGNLAIVVGADIVGTSTSAIDIAAPNVLIAGNRVGSQATPIETSTQNLAGQARVGDFVVRNSSAALNVTDVTGIGGINAAGNLLCLDSTGSIVVANATRSGGNVALRSGGEIVVNGTTIQAANTVSLEAVGNIQDSSNTNVDINATNFVAVSNTGSIGSRSDALEVTVSNISARAAGSIVVNDTTGDLTVTDLTTLKGGIAVTGVNAGANVCIDASAGSLAVNSAVSGVNVHLGALNDVAMNANTAATNQLEVLASNGGISGGGQLSSQELILASNSSIGPVQVQAQRLAATSASGDVNVVSNGPLELANLTSFKSGTAYNGVNAAGLVDIDSAGALNITGGVVAGGSVALRSTGDIAFSGNGIQSGSTVSLEAGGSIVDNNAASLDVNATNLVATAGNEIGGIGNPLDVAVTNIATRSGGSTSVNAQSSNLAVTDLSTLKGNTTVSGVNATGNTSIQSSGGLSLNSNVAAGGDVHLQAGNTLAFAGGTVQTPNTAVLNATNIVSAPGNATDVNASNLLVIGNTGSPTDPLQTTASNFAGQSAAGNLVVTSSNANFVITNVTSALYTGTAVSGAQAADLICLEGAGAIQNAAPITAGNTVALRADNLIVSGALVSAGNLISVESPNGVILSNTFGQTNFQAPNVVLSAEDIGNLGPVAVNASNLAARATLGNVNLLSLSSNVNTADLTLVKSGTLVQGLTASNAVCLDASNGSVQINNPVSAGTDIALRSSGDLSINSTLTAADTVSLESGGSIRNQNAGVDVNAANSVATAVGNVDLDLNVTNFAAQAANINATGVTNVASLNTLKGNTTVTGLNATANVCVDAPGALNVNAAISGGNTVALRSAGNLNVNAAVNAGSKISAESTAGNIQSSSNITQFSANDVALRAGDIGSAQPLTVQAQRLAAQATTGNVQLNLTSTNTQTANLTLDKSGTLLQGVNANNGVCLDSLNGTLLVNNPITAGNLIALRAFNQIALNSTLTTNNTISLESGGSIRNFGGGVDANAANLVATAGGNLDLDLNVTNFAAQATSVNVTGLVNTATLNTAKGNVTVVGVNAMTFANLRGPGAVNINSAINAGDRVSLQSAGDINSNAATSAGNRISFESIGGSIVDGNGNLVNLSATDIVLRANLNIGGSDAIETQASRLGAQAQLGSLMIANTSPTLQVASLSLEGSENSISGLRAALTACLTQTGSLNVVSASNASELSMMAGGDIAIANNLTAANKLSLESTGGSIASTVNDTNAHLTAPNLVLSAQNNIASLANPLLVNTDNLAARAQTGNLGIVDLTPGLNITSQVLSCSNLNVQGVSAQNQLRVGALQGDMVVQNGSTIAAGSSVNITVANGNFFQNGTGTAIQSGGSAVVNTGCDFQVGNVGAPVAANVTGILTLITNNATTIGQPDDRLVVNTCMTPMAPMAPGVPPVNNTVNPPAQDNVFLGEIQEYYPMTGMMFGLVEERPRYPLSMLVLAVIESGKTNYQLENFFPNTLMEAKERQLEKPLTWGQGLDIPGQSTAFFVDPTQGYSYTQSVLENKVQLNWPTSLAAGSQSAFEQAVRDSLANDHLPSGIVENLIAQMREQNGPFMLMRVPALPGVENSPVLLMLMPYKP